MAEFQPIRIGQNLLAGQQGAQQVQSNRQANELRALQLQQGQQQMSRDEQFRNQLGTYLQGGTNALAAMYQADPERAMQVQAFQGQQNQIARQQEIAIAKESYGQAQAVIASKAPADYFRILMPDKAAALAKQLGKDVDELTDEDATGIAERVSAIAGAKAGILPQQPESFTLAPGQARFSGGKQVAALPSDSEGAAGFTLGQGQTRFGPDGRPIASVAAAPPTDAVKFGQADKLRDEFNKQSTEFIGVANSYQRIKDSASDPSAAGDLSLIFNYMKVLDPGSTVREGEFATAQSAGSVPSQILARYNKVLSGERLAPEQRKDFVTRAKKLYEGQQGRWERNVKGRYEKLSKDLGVDPKYVLGDFDVSEVGTQPTASEPTATGPNGEKIVLRNGQWQRQ